MDRSTGKPVLLLKGSNRGQRGNVPLQGGRIVFPDGDDPAEYDGKIVECRYLKARLPLCLRRLCLAFPGVHIRCRFVFLVLAFVLIWNWNEVGRATCVCMFCVRFYQDEDAWEFMRIRVDKDSGNAYHVYEKARQTGMYHVLSPLE